MTMLSQRLFEEVSQKISDAMASSPAKDIEKNVKATLAAGFARLDLVTREEFEVQQGVLAKTREKLEALELRLAELESRHAPADASVDAHAANPQDEL